VTVDSPHAYVAEHVHQALAEDPRVHEPELEVDIVADRAFVSGVVHTQDRRHAIDAVVAERFPELECVNQTTVMALPPPSDAETLP
jgi:hypothetical protein